jgi:hypothetical protein
MLQNWGLLEIPSALQLRNNAEEKSSIINDNVPCQETRRQILNPEEENCGPNTGFELSPEDFMNET